MTITGEKIGPQRPQLQRNLSNTMRPVDNAQDAQLATDLHHSLERKPYGRHTDHRLEQCSPNPHPLPLRPLHRLPKRTHHLLNAHGEPHLDLQTSHARQLAHRDQHAFNGPVHGPEVDHCVAWPETEVMQDGVHARRRILDQCQFRHGHVE